MTSGDFQFMKEMGIAPCHLNDPFPISLPLPPRPAIPTLSKKDACWLQNLWVTWEQDPEPGFEPPESLREYLACYPDGIRRAVGETAKCLGLALSDDDLDDLAQDIVVMLLDFSTDLEDVVEMYPFYSPVRPGERRSAHFHDYIRLRVMACVQTLLEQELPSRRNWRSPLDF